MLLRGRGPRGGRELDQAPAQLWQNRPPNLKKEREYNRRTECSGSVDSPVMAPGGRMRTKPLIPEACFTTITEEDAESDQQPPTPHLHDDGTSLLISCSQCSVRVHTSQCHGHGNEYQ
ncbi:hypothetical protein CRUP_006821 [Coryphaenoides rupestris]|nr:hypothetical protein CRUP_006821 [Coryphaenoides rupestris]